MPRCRATAIVDKALTRMQQERDKPLCNGRFLSQVNCRNVATQHEPGFTDIKWCPGCGGLHDTQMGFASKDHEVEAILDSIINDFEPPKETRESSFREVPTERPGSLETEQVEDNLPAFLREWLSQPIYSSPNY